MAVYWLSFRIAEKKTEKGTDVDRRKALYDAIKKIQPNVWEVPTSFILFETAKDIDAIAAICKNAVSPSEDSVILRKIDGGNVRFIGSKVDFDNLKKIHPNSNHCV